MIDHIGIPVSDYARSVAFYTQALAPLGIGLVMEVTPEMTGNGSAAGFGDAGKPYFWLGDNGAPGLRPHYHEHYYGAFVLDPDGHNIEAVCHLPEAGS